MIVAILSEVPGQAIPRVQEEMRALQEAGHEVELCAISPRPWAQLTLYYAKVWKWLSVRPRIASRWRSNQPHPNTEGMPYTHVHATHVFQLPVAITWAKFHKAKVIYDCYEFYGQCRWWLRPIENWLVRRCDGVVTVTSVDNIVSTRLRKNCPNTAILFNAPYLRDNQVARRDPDNHILAYVGKPQENKGWGMMQDVLDILEKEYPDIQLDPIYGLSYDDMLHHLSLASIGLALHQPHPDFDLVTYGNGRKFFSYMQAGLPIVGPEWGHIGEIIRMTSCGMVCDTTDAHEVAKRIRTMWERPDLAAKQAQWGREAIERTFNFNREAQVLLKVYEEA